MANDYYTHGSYPSTGAPGRSADLRAELNLVDAGFGKLAPLVGNAFHIAFVNAGETGWSTLGGTGLLKLRAADVPTLAIDGTDYVSPTGAATLTNKTIVVASNTITTAAHGTLTAVELNAALAELADDDAAIFAAAAAALSAHITDPTDAHAASAVTNTPAGNIAATTVQAALNELDTEKVAKAGDTMTGDLTFSGNGRRLKADFSNATHTNRLMFQTTTANGATVVGAVPNGTSRVSSFAAYSNPDPDNASEFVLACDSATAISILNSTQNGTGVNLAISFQIGGTERGRLLTGGEWSFGTTLGTANQGRTQIIGTNAGNDLFALRVANTSGAAGASAAISFDPGNSGLSTRDSQIRALNDGANNTNFQFYTSAAAAPTPKFRIDHVGNCLALATGGGIGYGTGAGGTVTQNTNKSTGVTLNRPSGRITMNNAALAANTLVEFTFTNSILASGDGLVLNVTGGTANAVYALTTRSIASGSIVVGVRNTSAGSLSEAIEITFNVIKGVTA